MCVYRSLDFVVKENQDDNILLDINLIESFHIDADTSINGVELKKYFIIIRV